MKNLFLIILVSFFALSCSTDDDANGTINDPDPDPNSGEAVSLRSDSTFGDVLVDSEGFTLYFFAPDAKGESNCSGGCADTWPPFFTDDLTLGTGLNQSDFGTITRNDGQSQITYKGWPLYNFSSDTQAGQINGDGAGGTWFVGKPDYSIMLVRAQLVGRDANGVETNLNSAFEPGDEETFYITDDRGNTLYSFSNDYNGVNNFTADDFSNNASWPIFHTQLENIPSTLNVNDFGVIDVFGQSQMTYKGWPLYYFGGDDDRGDNFGVGFPVAGVWPTLNADSQSAPDAPAATPNVRILSIDPATNSVTLKNFGNADGDISGLWFCNFPAYAQVNGMTSTTSLAPNEEIVITSTIDFDVADGEFGLYNTNSFGSSDAMEDYLQWGSAGHQRESVAVAAGLWTAGTFLNTAPPFNYSGDGTQNGVDFWN